MRPCSTPGKRGFLLAFAADRAGAILPMYAFFSLIIIGVAGAALDYGRATRSKVRINTAADAATLAAVRAATDIANANPTMSRSEVANRAEAIGRQFMLTNLASGSDASMGDIQLKVKFKDGSWLASMDYKASISTTLTSVIGFSSIDLSGSSGSSIKPGFPVLDIAMCVDSTGSMTPTLDAVKTNALTFFDNLNTELNARGIPSFPLVRVRLIFFKDFGDITPGWWDPDPIRASDFMSLPREASDFSSFVSPQMAGGGGDITESGLECLNMAMSSSWMKVGQVPAGFSEPVTDVYPLVVIWTDAPSHVLPYPNSLANPAYPPETQMPRSLGAFRSKWDDPDVIDQINKQILFFGDPNITAGEDSGWLTIKTWPKFTVGGTLTQGSASMIEFLATGIANSAKGLRLTQ
jgi:hypothetical protein